MEETKYILVPWPESQEYMGKRWFRKECFLMNDMGHLDSIGSSAFFIPENRIKN